MKEKVLTYLLAIGIIAIVTGSIFSSLQVETVEGKHLKKFSSCDQIKNFMETNVSPFSGGFFASSAMAMNGGAVATGAREAGPAAEDYSTTNVQVTGVDEADIVKNDGKYIYVVSGGKVTILDAYPAESAEVLSEIEFSGSPSEIFINDDKLIVFGTEYSGYGYGVAIPEIYPPVYSSKSFVHVYDVSDRETPVMVRNVSIEGSYFDSRMIGDYVYAVINQPLTYQAEQIRIPTISSNGEERPVCGCVDVYYFDNPDYSFKFTTIMAVDTQDDNKEPTTEVYLMGYSHDMYVSLDNIYITYMKQFSYMDYIGSLIDEVVLPIVPAGVAAEIQTVEVSGLSLYEKLEAQMQIVQAYSNSLTGEAKSRFDSELQNRTEEWTVEFYKQMEKTIIHKISIKDGDIEYKTQGDVPGNVLNQFSMDENNGYFRIATTTGQLSRSFERATSKNHVYVLDQDLKIVGKLEDLAPGESIYSARFVGDRGYLVTFRKIDPLFVIDLKEPSNPTILGELKIPGYSDYLHPYDENHIIGIGKATVGAEQGDFAWYQGVKMSLFDVTDVENPKEVSKYEIGDRGTDSYALHDHKAFLFSKSKNLLVIPVLIAEIDEEKYQGEIPPNAFGDYVWQGAYVFDLTLENGFVLKGGVTHVEDESSFLKSGYYYRGPYSVKRALYMDDVLYTVSDKMVKMNNFGTLEEINEIELPEEPVRAVPL